MKPKVLTIILLSLFLLSTIIGLWKVYRLREENISLKEKIKDKEEEIFRLLLKLEEKTKQITSLEEKIEEEKALRENLIEELKKKEEEIAKEQEVILELQDKLSKREIEFKNLLARVKDLELIKKDLEKKLKELEIKTSAVELGKIEVKEDIQTTTPFKKLEGKILVVNKDYDFAVINLGKNDGLSLSDTLSVYQKDKYLGNVKVEELRDKLAVVNFDADIKDKIKEGDTVIFLTE